ncbi:MAG: succinate--CoA ligase subunit beta [Blastocatellia bacterium]|nr:succinate--CoA ligase subunit beta [Blastocatellia bacterium]
MNLYEYEGKSLLKKYGIRVPDAILMNAPGNLESFVEEYGEVAVKAQVLAGKRGKAGGIRFCKTTEGAELAVELLLNSTIRETEVVGVLVEQKLEVVNEFYLSITFDGRHRAPVVIISRMGGVDVEELAAQHPDQMFIHPIDSLFGLQEWKAREIAAEAGFREDRMRKMADFLVRAYRCFRENDVRLLEINPVIETRKGNLFAADAVVILDGDAMTRHRDFNYPPRGGLGRPLTERELQARLIDQNDYRGVAGKYIELDGDIAMMSAGGGGSITNMDALISYGGRPANYTEYGGNPPAEKVEKLTKVVLSKPGLTACWHVGAVANNTRVDITMQGFIDGLRAVRPAFPIVIRRGGPGWDEARVALEEARSELNLDMTIFGPETPMTESARIVLEKSRQYQERMGKA